MIEAACINSAVAPQLACQARDLECLTFSKSVQGRNDWICFMLADDELKYSESFCCIYAW